MRTGAPSIRTLPAISSSDGGGGGFLIEYAALMSAFLGKNLWPLPAYKRWSISRARDSEAEETGDVPPYKEEDALRPVDSGRGIIRSAGKRTEQTGVRSTTRPSCARRRSARSRTCS